MVDKAFPGRVIFDHLPKTAGQAINAWLMDALGAACITPNLIGNHLDLIRQYGGLYSVISAHIHFNAGEGLDPRYQYITFFREPVDRVVSWLYFVLNNHDDSQLPEFRAAVKCFLDSDGLDVSSSLFGHISNVYVEHFHRINGSGLESDEEKIAQAFVAIQQYDVVGIYQDMPQFLADVADLIGLYRPQQLSRVNVTTQRPQLEQISPALRERIVALNQLDLRLFVQIEAWKAAVWREMDASNTPALPTSLWKKYERVHNGRVFTTADLRILSVTLREGGDVRHGQLMTFDVDFFLSRDVHDLEMGIHLFDSDHQWAFGTNSTLLGQSHRLLPSGAYRVSHHVLADLPAGTYTAGFAFAELLATSSSELSWHDALCTFHVYYQVSQYFAGYAYLPAEISLCPRQIATSYVLRADDSRLSTMVGERDAGCMVSTGKEGCLLFGPYIPLAAGQYQVRIHCSVGERGLAGARMDIVADKGNRFFAECALALPDENGCFIVSLVLLTEACHDLEIRVWVNEGTDLQIAMIEIVLWQDCLAGAIVGHNFAMQIDKSVTEPLVAYG